MTDAVTAAPDDHRPALGGFGVLARWVWVSAVAIFAGLALKGFAELSPGLTGAAVAFASAAFFALMAWVGPGVIVYGSTAVAECCRNLSLIGVGVVMQRDNWVWVRGRLVGGLVVVVCGVGTAGLAMLVFELIGPLFPPGDDLVDTRADKYLGHSVAYVWVLQLIDAGLSEELVFRSPVLAAYLLLRVSTLARSRFAWALWAIGSLGWTTAFGLIHLDYGMWNVAPAFVMGVVFVGVTVLTRTLWTSVIGHTTYNTWTVFANAI